MTAKPIPKCGEHQVLKEWRTTSFEYKEENISVCVPNVYAWVCPVDGEASFTPETVDELITVVREFLKTAKRARKQQSSLREYVISVE